MLVDPIQPAAARSWIDDMVSGFTAWLAAQPTDVQAQEQRWWDLIAEGLPAWLVDQPPEVSEAMGWQGQIDLYIKEHANVR